MSNNTWEDHEILDALELRDEGCTMRQIAVYLGRSRNSVIGQVNRTINESLKYEIYDE